MGSLFIGEPIFLRKESEFMEKVFYLTDLDLYQFKENKNNYTGNVQIMRTGEWEHEEYGHFEITEGTMETLIKNFNENVRGIEIPITIGHPTDGNPEPPAVGWFKKLSRKDGELWGKIEWTKPGWEKLQEKEYKYFSPEFYFNYKDPESQEEFGVTLVGGAMTNKPFLKGMTPVIMSEKLSVNLVSPTPQEPHIGKSLEIKKIKREEVKKMANGNPAAGEVKNIKNEITDDEVVIRIPRAKVEMAEGEVVIKGNPDDLKPPGEWWDKCVKKIKEGNPEYSEEQVNATCGSMYYQQEGMGATEKAEPAVKGKEEEEMKVEAALTAIKTMSEKVEGLEGEIKKSKVDSAVKKAISDGKITPKMRDSWAGEYAIKDLDGFMKFIEITPRVVSLSELGADSGGEEGKEEGITERATKLAEEKKISFKEAVVQVASEDKEKTKRELSERPMFSGRRK